MRDRRGVILLCFDLPVNSNNERKKYREFKKKLLAQGFIQLQKSVYILLLHNLEKHHNEIQKVYSYAPEDGSIVAFPLTFADFENIVQLSHSSFDLEAFSNNLVIL